MNGLIDTAGLGAWGQCLRADCRASSARRGDEIDPLLDRYEISSLAVSATRFSILAKSAVENGAWSKAYEPICLVHLRDPARC